VQQARKDAGLHVSDRIVLTAEVDDATKAALSKHASYIQEQVLAVEVAYGPAAAIGDGAEGAFAADGKVGSDGGAVVRLTVAKLA
jgi:isoleucyl-tRNA synthetase